MPVRRHLEKIVANYYPSMPRKDKTSEKSSTAGHYVIWKHWSAAGEFRDFK